MQIDLNRLRVFFTVFTRESVSEAARQLSLSQPAVSQHLQKLEKELGVQLFTRIHKKLLPTAAAIQLHQIVEPFLATLPEALAQLKLPSDVPSCQLRLGAPYEFGQAYLPDICHGFRQQYPDVRFRIKLGESLSLLKSLREGELDFAVIDLLLASLHFIDQRTEMYSMDALIEEELAMICSRDYYDREIRGDHSCDNLITKEFISDEHDDSFLRHWFAYHFGTVARQPNIVVMVESHQANLRCVKLGMGLTITSSHMVWKEIAEGSMVPINTAKPNAINTISLVQLQDKIPTVTEKTFHRYIRKHMQGDAMLRRFNILPEAAAHPDIS